MMQVYFALVYYLLENFHQDFTENAWLLAIFKPNRLATQVTAQGLHWNC
jgi:hypothetical protein